MWLISRSHNGMSPLWHQTTARNKRGLIINYLQGCDINVHVTHFEFRLIRSYLLPWLYYWNKACMILKRRAISGSCNGLSSPWRHCLNQWGPFIQLQECHLNICVMCSQFISFVRILLPCLCCWNQVIYIIFRTNEGLLSTKLPRLSR